MLTEELLPEPLSELGFAIKVEVSNETGLFAGEEEGWEAVGYAAIGGVEGELLDGSAFLKAILWLQVFVIEEIHFCFSSSFSASR